MSPALGLAGPAAASPEKTAPKKLRLRMGKAYQHPGPKEWAQMNLNAALVRNFHIRERDTLQFRRESFNATNHTNFRLPVNNLSLANAGRLRARTAAAACSSGFVISSDVHLR